MKTLNSIVLFFCVLGVWANALNAQCSQTISTFPHTSSFESSNPVWGPLVTSTTPNCTTWIKDAAGTPSSSTGPSSAQSGSYYAYVEASGPCNNNTPPSVSLIYSPCYNLSGMSSANVSFYYHMYGANVGTLTLMVSTDGGASWSTLWSRSGDQSNSWQQETVNLNAYTNQTIELRFDGIIGNGWQGDMAVDNITVDAAGSSGAPDLAVFSPSAPSAANAGSSISVSCTVSNSGTGSANSSTLGYYLSTNSTYDNNDTSLGSDAVGGLVAGGTSPESASLLLPSTLTTGTYYIIFRADSGNTVAESNESNNNTVRSINITAVPNCSDGIQNGNETGVDCGGSCPPCGGSGGTSLWTQNGSSIYYNTGNVGIGLTSPTEKLTVSGTVLAKEFRATLSYPWPDYVFASDYDLMPLKTVETYIRRHGHLPNIPSASEIEKYGVNLAEMNAKLLEKIEELTLHAIELEKRIEELEKEE